MQTMDTLAHLIRSHRPRSAPPARGEHRGRLVQRHHDPAVALAQGQESGVEGHVQKHCGLRDPTGVRLREPGKPFHEVNGISVDPGIIGRKRGVHPLFDVEPLLVQGAGRLQLIERVVHGSAPFRSRLPDLPAPHDQAPSWFPELSRDIPAVRDARR